MDEQTYVKPYPYIAHATKRRLNLLLKRYDKTGVEITQFQTYVIQSLIQNRELFLKGGLTKLAIMTAVE